MLEIKCLEAEFNMKGIEIIDLDAEFIINYPTNYIIYSTTTAYIGESVRVKKRLKEHLNNKERKQLQKVIIFGHQKFNQSATNNIETNLINYFIADKNYIIQNMSKTKGNNVHEYYNRDEFDKKIFGEIWEKLRDLGVARDSIEVLENRDVFKLSPFKELSEEQLDLKYEIIKFCEENINIKGEHSVIFVEGEAGTGKSVLLSSTFNYLLNEAKNKMNNNLYLASNNYLLVNHSEMIKTYKEIAGSLSSFKKKNILKPTSFINGCLCDKIKNVDIVFLDEGHMGLSKPDSYNSFRLDNHIEEIIKRSSVTVVFYDPRQVLKLKSYWSDDMIRRVKIKYNAASFKLTTQFRMQASKEFMKWINGLVYGKIDALPKNDIKYDFEVFDNAYDMHCKIVKKNKECSGLCRVVSTFDYVHKKDGKKYYVEEPGFKLPWNSYYQNSWAENDDSINEVGSIYTVLGFDLNYVGVILGPSVQYDEKNCCLKIVPELYCDTEAFRSRGDIKDIYKAKTEIILNSINVLVKRGVKGLYIYASDEKLRKKLMEIQGNWKE